MDGRAAVVLHRQAANALARQQKRGGQANQAASNDQYGNFIRHVLNQDSSARSGEQFAPPGLILFLPERGQAALHLVESEHAILEAIR